MNFTAVDVETANPDLASICQIGVAKYIDGKLVEEWSELINPEEEFDFCNVSIHGIHEDDVAESPKFPEVACKLGEFLNNTICVSHGAFDRVAINRALAKYELQEINTTWLSTMPVVRRTWTGLARRGYGLANVCEKIGYKFKHHDALDDAKACAQVLLAAMDVSGLDIESWLKRVKRPINLGNHPNQVGLKWEGNPEGEMYGEVMVMTGSLEIVRRDAAQSAANIGCAVDPSVTKRTTILVVGDQDISKFRGKEKSRKHLKAEEFIEKGQDIKILIESDFHKLIEQMGK